MWAAWLLASAALAYSVVAGRRLQRETPEIFLGAAPLVGQRWDDGWDWRFGWGAVAAVAVVAVVIATQDRLRRAGTRTVVVLASLTSGVVALLLALVDGSAGLSRGAGHETEYLANLEVAPPAAEFVRTFVDEIQRYSVHVRGHPPGFVLALMGLDAAGLEGVWPVVALSLLGTFAVTAAVLVAVAAACGREWMVAVAPFMVVSPYLLWMLTSADAVFTAVAAWSVTLLVLAVRRSGWRAAALGAGSGLLLGALLFLTYGGATFALALLVLLGAAWSGGLGAASRRVVLSVAVAGTVAVVAVTAAFALAGFWWLEGARETRRQYWAGTAQFRPFGYFLVANLAVAVIAIGPVGYAALIRLGSATRTWRAATAEIPTRSAAWLVAGGLAALLASHLSQYTRAEVERIWLLFYPWLIVATGVVGTTLGRRWLMVGIAVQAAATIGLQSVLVSKW